MHARHGEWVILSDALRAERPSLWAVQPRLTRKREELVCVGVRACVCACREERHCSLTSPLSPACRCSQTRLCYSEASTRDRPSAKHGAPPADWRGLPRITHTRTLTHTHTNTQSTQHSFVIFFIFNSMHIIVYRALVTRDTNIK